MKIKIKKPAHANLQVIMRQLGYKPIGTTDRGELNCVRPTGGGDYPRFHAYIAEIENEYVFSLHLDQKKPSYGKETRHSGDYDSEIVKDELGFIYQKLGGGQ